MIPCRRPASSPNLWQRLAAAAEEDTDLPPELRSHRVRSAIEEVRVK